MNESTPIRVMIVDDHLLVRDGLKLLLSTFDDLEVVALAEDGQDAVELCPEAQPDVALMDIMMPNVDGPTATKRIRESYPQVQVIALTSFMEEELIQRAIGAGAIGYLLKNVSATQLAEAIRAAHQGRSTMDPAAVQTDREREVLALLVDGKTNKEIADELTLSTATVRGYVSNILSKLEASNRTEAASLALQHKLIS
jgi:NarL family two-component system response regulator LiaR